MSAQDKRIADLVSEWMKLIRDDHHKDRDCHFTIRKTWSYGEMPKYNVEHRGYIADYENWETDFPTYNAALADLEAFLVRIIAREREDQQRLAKENQPGEPRHAP